MKSLMSSQALCAIGAKEGEWVAALEAMHGDGSLVHMLQGARRMAEEHST